MQRPLFLVAVLALPALLAGAGPIAKFPAWADPRPVDELNDSGDQWTPWISADGLAILYAHEPAGSSSQRLADIRMATRPDRASPFGPASAVASLNTPDSDELMPTMTADGLEVVFFRQGATSRLMMARRDSVAEDFEPATQLAVLYEGITLLHYPQISPDGLSLHLSGRPSTQIGVLSDIFVSTRPNRGASFTTAAQLPGLSSATADENSVWMSPDLLTAWTVYRPQTAQSGDIAVATRSTPAAAFAAPVPIAELSAPGFTASPALTADGLEMFFFSNRTGGEGGLDIWRAPKAEWSLWVVR